MACRRLPRREFAVSVVVLDVFVLFEDPARLNSGPLDALVSDGLDQGHDAGWIVQEGFASLHLELAPSAFDRDALAANLVALDADVSLVEAFHDQDGSKESFAFRRRHKISPATATKHLAKLSPTLRAASLLDQGKFEEALDRIRAGANPNGRTKDGKPFLTFALEMREYAMFDALLAASADPNTRDPEGLTAVHWALIVERDNIRNLTALLERGGDLEARTIAGLTPLLAFLDRHGDDPMADSDGGGLSVLEALLDQGADPSVRCARGGNALFYAGGQPRYERRLRQLGIEELAVPRDAYAGREAPAELLFVGVKHGDPRPFRQAMERLHDIGLYGMDRALRMAVRCDRREMAAELLARGADPLSSSHKRNAVRVDQLPERLGHREMERVLEPHLAAARELHSEIEGRFEALLAGLVARDDERVAALVTAACRAALAQSRDEVAHAAKVASRVASWTGDTLMLNDLVMGFDRVSGECLIDRFAFTGEAQPEAVGEAPDAEKERLRTFQTDLEGIREPWLARIRAAAEADEDEDLDLASLLSEAERGRILAHFTPARRDEVDWNAVFEAIDLLCTQPRRIMASSQLGTAYLAIGSPRIEAELSRVDEDWRFESLRF